MPENKGRKAHFKQKLFLEMTAYWINVAYLTILFAVFTSYRKTHTGPLRHRLLELGN